MWAEGGTAVAVSSQPHASLAEAQAARAHELVLKSAITFIRYLAPIHSFPVGQQVSITHMGASEVTNASLRRLRWKSQMTDPISTDTLRPKEFPRKDDAGR